MMRTVISNFLIAFFFIIFLSPAKLAGMRIDVKLEEKKPLREIHKHTHHVKSVCVTPDGKNIISGAADKTIGVWDIDDETKFNRWEAHAGSVNSVCVMQDGEGICSGSSDRSVAIWDLRTGSKLTEFYEHTTAVNSVCAVDDKRIVSASMDGTLFIWDVKTKRRIGQCDKKGRQPVICRSSDRKKIICGSFGELWIWDLETQEILPCKPYLPRNEIHGVCVTPDGKKIAAGCVGALLDPVRVDICNMIGGRCSTLCEGHEKKVLSVCATADNRIISAGDDKTIRIWDIEGKGVDTEEVTSGELKPDYGKQIACWQAHNDSVNSVCVTPDNKKVVSGSSDHRICVWDK